MTRKYETPEEWEQSFWNRIATDDNGCWIWLGHEDHRGYGRRGPVPIPGQSAMAHIAAWNYLNGPVPDGLELDHLCRVKLCVNPAHLEPVTATENNRRAMVARHLEQDTCANGHLWADNWMPRKGYKLGARQCRECQRLSNQRSRAKKKAERERNATLSEDEPATR